MISLDAALSSPVFRASTRFLMVFAVIGLAGCATSEFNYTKKISTGERLTFRLVEGRVIPPVADGFEGRAPLILPDKEKSKVQFVFGLAVKTTEPIARVRVEDVSDAEAMLLVDDAAPQPKQQLWIGHSAWFDLENPEAGWISYLGEAFRVYRITVTKADGHTVVLHQGSLTPSFAKAMLRDILGKKV